MHSQTTFETKTMFKTISILMAGLVVALFVSTSILIAQEKQGFEIQSPDGAVIVHVTAGVKLEWSVQHRGEQIIAPSAISLQFEGGDVLGDNAKIISSDPEKVNSAISAINYI